MNRQVRRELMDELPADHPGAMQSRRDLRRINAWMGNAAILAQALKQQFSRHLSFRMAELGAGDGEFMLRVAQRLRGNWRSVDTVLIDQQDLLAPETQSRFDKLKWRVRPTRTDALKWLMSPSGETFDVITANLFLHHFSDETLRELFRHVAARSPFFIAVEPRRSRAALFFSRCLWLVGCNSVTRHDAVVSVRAGFSGRELFELWPDHDNWELTECPAGSFSHLFIARRREKFENSVVKPVVSAVFEHGNVAAGSLNGAAPPVVSVPDSPTAQRED